MSFARREPRVNYTAALAFPRPTRAPKEPKQLRPRSAAPGERPKYSTLAPGKRMQRNRKTKQQIREVVFAPYEKWLTSPGALCVVCGTPENIQGAHVGVVGMGMRNGTAADKIRLCGPRVDDIGCHARFDQTVPPWTRATKAVFSRHQRQAHWEAFRAWALGQCSRAIYADDDAAVAALLACDVAISGCLAAIEGGS